MEKEIITDVYGIVVNLIEGAGSIMSDLKEVCPYCGHPYCYFDCDQSKYDNGQETEEDACSRRYYNSAMDGIESIILSHAIAGIDITTPEYKEGIETAVQGCASNM